MYTLKIRLIPIYGVLNILVLLFLTTSNAQAESAPFLHSLEPYKPIYALNSWFLDREGEEQNHDDRELIMQFSLKKQLYKALYFGFSYKAFWQIYDVDDSRPFREQNYNPEGFLEYTDLWGLDVVRLGLIEHESNGEKQVYDEQGEPINYSRTWDRSYLYFWKNLGEYFGLGLKVWVVTSSKNEEMQAFYNDNADMQQYMGSGELYASVGSYPTVITFMFRHGWKKDTETCRIEARIPTYHFLKMEDSGYDIYFQYFSGYGDSLIDYNRRINRVAIGLSFR